MSTLKPLYQNIIATLKDASKNAQINIPELDARIIIERRTDYSWSDIIASPNSIITNEQLNLINSDVKSRLAGQPLSRIYNEREFWGLPFSLVTETLDPRPDTETIIDLAIKIYKDNSPKNILDMGTGSGCILISLLLEFKDAIGYGSDLSFEAVSCARKNAEKNQCAERSHFLCGSWMDPIIGEYDLIVSNPPYISNQIISTLSPEVQNHDPILALNGGDDGLTPYKNIFPKLKNILKPAGIALFEIGYDQEKDILRLAEDSGFARTAIHQDLAGNPRVVEISRGDK